MTNTREGELRAIGEALAHLTDEELAQFRAATQMLFKAAGAPGNTPDSQTTEKD